MKVPPTTPPALTRVEQRVAEKLPAGGLNVISGAGANMAGLIQNPDVAKVCFTGSVNGGKRRSRLDELVAAGVQERRRWMSLPPRLHLAAADSPRTTDPARA
ncbi:MAG: aldehyde dehydrogenase family protein [Microbacterium sp.]|uniref:aldehyde dehydrogenase family protein n=1 Tax=Microbacterium sp. TaxID=51671 RepID=UPI003A8ACE99